MRRSTIAATELAAIEENESAAMKESAAFPKYSHETRSSQDDEYLGYPEKMDNL